MTPPECFIVQKATEPRHEIVNPVGVPVNVEGALDMGIEKGPDSLQPLNPALLIFGRAIYRGILMLSALFEVGFGLIHCEGYGVRLPLAFSFSEISEPFHEKENPEYVSVNVV